MKIALAVIALVLGALWCLIAASLIIDWYGCDWFGEECGPEDGWAALILGPFVAMAGIVIVPLTVIAIVYLVGRIRGRSAPRSG